ncbi:hypothetical protein [Arcticibacterium luteifluviistationis]|uniref:hypothetical protein n=1 Tax=Arcticibacterium luteifluviistationis TaxID=1784714 RepID=UPI00195506A8|nr:hypothetical protein [Arcticibacterium luteifluviistationis]
MPKIWNSCGDGSAVIKIGDNKYCGVISECPASLNYNSPCNKGGNGDKLIFWYFFDDVVIEGYKFDRISFLCVVEGVEGKGTYSLKVVEKEYDSSSFDSWDTQKTLSLKSGVIDITKLKNQKLKANLELIVLFDGREVTVNSSLNTIDLE